MAIEIYYTSIDSKVLTMNTNQLSEEMKSISANTADEAIKKFSEEKLELDSSQEDELEEIFRDDESTADSSNEDLSEGFRIKHWISNRSFGELIDMYNNNEIKKPEMQREFVWNSSKSSRLIESIVLGLPIPPLFLLEVNDNEYEIIDGYQRLTTVFNYVKGNPWTGKKENGRNVAAKLSNRNILQDISGKSFEELEEKYKRKIRRSTIPLLEFKQLTPGDFSSKYLIFERINTGSAKLNAMQIRKSLAYGTFMDDLYKYSNENKNYLKLFTINQIKNDVHVEAFLRFLAITDIYYEFFSRTKNGIKNMLDEYCEYHRNGNIDTRKVKKFFEQLEILIQKFESTNIFRRVNENSEFEGRLNIGILESLMGIIVKEEYDSNKLSVEKYKEIMKKLYEDALLREEKNPFSANTGTIDAIKRRYNICNDILGINGDIEDK